MSRLFEKTAINGLELENRFVRSATWEGMAEDDGSVTPKLIKTMADLAEGGVGLIVSSHAYVRRDGQAGRWQLGVFKDEHVSGLSKMASAVHDSGGKIVLQLAHAGGFAANALTGLPLLIVSDIETMAETPRREFTESDIEQLAEAYAQAAARAKSAGFDGVQIHSAHGYFLSQTLSPWFNRRTDEYGGDIQNRAKLLLMVYKAIRTEVGNDYPVMIKMNCRDFIENGLTLDDSMEVGKTLAEAGLDAIELSGGVLTSSRLSPSRHKIDTEEKEAYFREEAKAFKQAVDIPLILVGGMRSFEVAEKLVDEGVADYISLSRPLIREPGLIRRWREGDRRRAECKSDNLCFKPAMAGEGVYCLTEVREKEKERK